MDKYTKAVLTVIALSVLALPVKAEEKVWYCEMTSHVRLDERGVEERENTRFQFKVTPTELIFGLNPPFEGQRLDVTYYSLRRLNAEHETFRVSMHYGSFVYSIHAYGVASVIMAQCDEF